MDYYIIWCNLKNSHKDVEFTEAVHGYLGALKKDGRISDYLVTRRKLGFGPSELGEFSITLSVSDLAHLEQAFDVVAARSGELEVLHARVYSMVTDFRSALYRDFPDPQRSGKGE